MPEEIKKEEQQAKNPAIWISVITSIVSLLTYIFQAICGNRGGNAELSKGEKAKQLQKALDENKKAIKEAHKTDNLDKVRKMLGK